MRDEVVAALGRGDTAFRWIQAVEAPDVTHDGLQKSGRKFNNIDWKLKAALQKIAKDEVARQITIATEKEACQGRR